MSSTKKLRRRTFIGGVTAALASGKAIARAEAGPAGTGDKDVTNYAEVRGFNYQPSYGSHGVEVWGEKFDIAVFREELLRGKKYFPGMNTVRLWLSYDAYIRDPGAMPDRLHRVIDLADELGVRFIPTLFNGWHSCPDFGGISVEMLEYWGGPERFADSFGPYVDDVAVRHSGDDRILLWDLCNEPFNSARCAASNTVILEWLQRVRTRCEEGGLKAPICVGSVPSMDSIRMLEPLSDVITFHPYFAWNAWVKSAEQFEGFLDEAVAFGKSVGKPMLVTETGWGALDDKKRSEVLAVELGAITKQGLGFVVHLLHHTLVADGHRPEYGPISGAGYMAFVEKDGSLRPYHDIFNDY